MTSEPQSFIAALLSPAAYPEPIGKVELIQTDISLVFLTDRYAYKVKKPVRFDYLDFSTLEKRRYYCEREVWLNRRLCPEIYLGVAAITKDNDGLHIGGRGEAVEYAVKMLRLPQERMMDVMLQKDQVTPDTVGRIARKLASFHRHAERSPEIDAFGNIETIMQNTGENFAETRKFVGRTIPAKEYDKIRKYTAAFIKDNAPLFEERIRGGCIRDGHGDLHARNICITDGICIYDCIEFNDRFRYGDVASEAAFLAMDLDRYGRADLSRAFIRAYVDASGEKIPAGLLDFYKCYRACVRGKVESFELDDPLIDTGEKERVTGLARGYFDLAASYTVPGPWLFITVGLTGSGKSTLASALAARLGLAVISSDTVRKGLARVPLTEHRYESFGGGIYSPEYTRRTYGAILDGAQSILKEGGKVILDASFIRRDERIRAKRVAESTGARFLIIELELSEEVVKKRLAGRQLQKAVSDGRWEIYVNQKDDFEPVNEAMPENHVIIDAIRPVNELVPILIERALSF